jgi:hypothetical protein
VFDDDQGAGRPAGVSEAGIDRHEWESEWATLEAVVADSPAEALPELDDLVGRMMSARGLELEEREGENALEPETTREYAEAHRIATLVDRGETVDPSDVGLAVQAFRTLYAYLLDVGPTSDAA